MTWWLGPRVTRERGVKTSVGWLRVTLGTRHNGHRDTVLCIMDRVPGISGIPRQGGGCRGEKLIVISESCHALCVNISQSGALKLNRWTNQRSNILLSTRYNNQSQRSLGLRQLSISQCFIKCIQISEPWGKRRLVRLWESIFGAFEMSKGKRSKRINSWLGYVSWSFLALVPRLVWWEAILR